MSKVVGAVVGVAIAAVGVITGNPLLIAQGASMAIGSLLTKTPNSSNRATTQRLSKSLVPEDFRKIVLGQTALASDLRYWEIFGKDNSYYDEVIAGAAHRVTSFKEFYLEEEQVPFSGTAAVGAYAGVLSRQTFNGAQSSIPGVGAGTYWPASSRFTGAAGYVLKWRYDEKKLPTGIPNRYTQVAEGAPVYDPRRDSTRPGGSGPHRANDQSTWDYSATDGNGKPIGRNNALQLLFYLIGWRVNGKLVAGRGVELADVDFQSFMAAANDAEALGYYTDCVLSTGDSHGTNESIISADGLIGQLSDSGGLWSYRIVRDDTAAVAVALGEDHVIDMGEVSWVPDKPMSEKYNEVVGTYIDPSAASLYQPRAYPMVFDAAYYAQDPYKKRRTQVFQCVQDPELAQKLARILLNKGRYQGEFSGTFNLHALRARLGDVVTLTLERYGFQAKLFRVLSQSVVPDGVSMLLREEHGSIYTGGTVVPQPAPSAGVKFDPRATVALTGLTAAPVSLVGPTGAAQDGIVVAWDPTSGIVRRVEVRFRQTGTDGWRTSTPNQGENTIQFSPLVSATEYEVQARTVTIYEVPGEWQQTSPAHVTTASQATASLDEIRLEVNAIASDSVLSHGSEKQKALLDYGALEAQHQALVGKYIQLGQPTDVAAAYQAAGGKILELANYLLGLVPDWRDVAVDTPIVAADWKSRWAEALAAMADFAAAITGQKGDKGDPGADALDISLSASADSVKYDTNNTIVSGPITFTAIRKNTAETPLFRFEALDGNGYVDDTAANLVAYNSAIFSSTGMDNVTITQAWADAAVTSGGGGFRVHAYVPSGSRAKKTLYKVRDGAKGADSTVPGPPGRPALVFYQDDEPLDPEVGDTWVRPADKVFLRYNGTTWVPALGAVSALDLVTANEIAVANLGAITANIGTLISYSGLYQRVERDGNGARLYDNSNRLRFRWGVW